MSLNNNDLRDTIIPRISIDEYLPKSGTEDEIIVVAFFAIDEAPAKDLDTFIETGAFEIIDVDVSPNPDEEGRYLIFLELKRQEDFWLKLDAIIEDVENLTGTENWMVSSNVLDYDCFVNEPELRSAVIVDPIEHAEDAAFPEVQQEGINSYLKSSMLLTVNRKDSILEVCDSVRSMKLEVVDFGAATTLIERQELVNTSLLDNPLEVRKLRIMLGEGWHVSKVKDMLVIDNNWSDTLLVTRYVE